MVAPMVMTDVWDAHCAAEFQTRDVEATLATMTDDACLIHVPVATGARGKEALRRFYAVHFIPMWPDDTDVAGMSRTVGDTRVVDELFIRCTHSQPMDFWLPGIPATGRPIALPVVAVVAFTGDKICSEHIYWDQASLLAQAGALDPAAAPMLGAEQGQYLLDATLPLNGLLAAGC